MFQCDVRWLAIRIQRGTTTSQRFALLPVQAKQALAIFRELRDAEGEAGHKHRWGLRGTTGCRRRQHGLSE